MRWWCWSRIRLAGREGFWQFLRGESSPEPGARGNNIVCESIHMVDAMRHGEREEAQAILERVAADVLPMMGYSANGVRRFVEENALLPGQEMNLVRLSRGEFALIKVRREGTLHMEYVLPSNWNRRHEIAGRALRLWRVIATATGGEMFLSVDEGSPSHNAYLLGMLPKLGFTLDPRVDFVGGADLADGVELPLLPDGVTERGFDPADVGMLNALYNEAFSAYPSREREEDPVGHVPKHAEMLASFRALYRDGRPVGLVFGMLGRSPYPALWNGRLNVEELAIHPAEEGKGLGRYLLLRCMRILRAMHPGKEFFVGTDRRFRRAVRLYEGMGLKAAYVHTYATWRPKAV